CAPARTGAPAMAMAKRAERRWRRSSGIAASPRAACGSRILYYSVPRGNGSARARAFEDAHDFGKAAPPRMSEWRDAIAVGDVGVGAAAEQQAHDLDMARPAIAEDHGLEQRRPAKPVDVVHGDARLQH